MDVKTFIIGFISAIIFMLILQFFFFTKKSYFDNQLFTPDMTQEQVDQIFETTANETRSKYDALIKDEQNNGRDAKPLFKEFNQAMTDLSTAYNSWSIEKQSSSPAPVPEQ